MLRLLPKRPQDVTLRTEGRPAALESPTRFRLGLPIWGAVLLCCLVAVAVCVRPASGAERTIDLQGGAASQVYGSLGKDQLGNDLRPGDVNGDGIVDLIAGAQWGSEGGRNIVGRAYAIFGRTSWPATIDLMGAGRDWSFMGAGRESRLGSAVAAADLNGDGIDDVILGSILGDPFSQVNGGLVDIMHGYRGASGDVDFLTDDPDALFAGQSVTEGSDQIGSDLATGDFNADGNLDVAVAAPMRGRFTGAVFVWWGPVLAGRLENLQTGAADWTITGPATPAFFGANLAAGDLDGDGVDDLVVSAITDGSDGPAGRGGVFIFRGRDDLGGRVDLAAGGAPTTVFTGPDRSDFGVSFSAGTCSCRGGSLAVADVTGDGMNDLLVGTPMADRGRGRAYVLAGPIAAGADPIDAVEHLEIVGGDADGRLGWTVAAGDLDGDGGNDLLVAAPWASALGRSSAGRVYGLRGPIRASGAMTLTEALADLVVNGPQAGAGTAGTSIVVADTDGDGVSDLHLGFPDDAPAGRRSVGSVFRLPGPVLVPRPTATATATETPSPSPTPTASATVTASATATDSPSPPTATETAEPSLTATATATATTTSTRERPSPSGPQTRLYLPLALRPVTDEP